MAFIWANRFMITYWQGCFAHGFFLFRTALWAHTTSFTLYLTTSVTIFTSPLGLLELFDDITAFIPTVHHPLKGKQEMTPLYSPQWWLCLMLNLHYSYWNKSLSSAIHHQRRRPFIQTWKTPFKKKRERETTPTDLSSNKSQIPCVKPYAHD